MRNVYSGNGLTGGTNKGRQGLARLTTTQGLALLTALGMTAGGMQAGLEDARGQSCIYSCIQHQYVFDAAYNTYFDIGSNYYFVWNSNPGVAKYTCTNWTRTTAPYTSSGAISECSSSVGNKKAFPFGSGTSASWTVCAYCT